MAQTWTSLDFGAGNLKAAEFELNQEGTFSLKRYSIRSLGLEGSQESAREVVLRKAIQELFTEQGFESRRVNVCVPGFQVFSKFIKLPRIENSKVTRIIHFEAQQNVPFPLEELVWDYQLLGRLPNGELEVLLVACKSDVLEGLFRTAEATGLKLQVIDASPAALSNAFRFNCGDLEGCSMLLDIGAKTANLLFIEKDKVYSRSINIGANAITQEFAAEFKLRFTEAEKIKLAEGFVSLGGAYQEPENPHQAAISKIARQVMTRLHIQIIQTIQYYTGQQGGSAPQRLFLAGGASIMPYAAQFFAEKLNLPVDYFNPFKNVQMDPAVAIDDLAKVAPAFGEVVGAALRTVAQCPVELNLLPKSIRHRQQFDEKKPYFLAAVFSLVLVVFAYGWLFDQMARVKASSLQNFNQQLRPLLQREKQLRDQEDRIRNFQAQGDALMDRMRWRLLFPDVLSELRSILIATERAFEESMPGTSAGVWIESFGTNIVSTDFQPESHETAENRKVMDELMKRYQIPLTEPAHVEAPNPLEAIPVRFRAVDLTRSGDSSGNARLAFAVERAVRGSPFFSSERTMLAGELEQVRKSDGTFSFGMVLKLRRPEVRLMAAK